MRYYENKDNYKIQIEIVKDALEELENFAANQDDEGNEIIWIINNFLDKLGENIDNPPKRKDWKEELNEKLDVIIQGIEKLQV